MRVMVLIKGTEDWDAGVAPDERLPTEMGRFNETLVKAGVMLDGEGLHTSARGVRVRFSGATRTVIDGPFAESTDLVAGYWLWQVKSFDEAIEWAKRCPNPMDTDSEIEIRQVLETEEHGPEFTPDARRLDERPRTQLTTR
jgi:hypothetical protein